MIETVMTAQMPVGLPIKIKKNRLEPDTIQEISMCGSYGTGNKKA